MPWEWKLTKDPEPGCDKQYTFKKYSWPIIVNKPLTKDFNLFPKDFLSVIESRRTRRKFNHIDESILSGVLWYTLREQGMQLTDDSRIFRPVPSAGATHSISLIIISPDCVVWRYNAKTHSKDILDVKSKEILWIRDDCKKLVDPGEGYILILVSELNRIASYYSNFESLIWRDSGVILGALSIITEAFHLSYCPLGISGDKWIRKMLHSSKQPIRGVGVSVLGGR